MGGKAWVLEVFVLTHELDQMCHGGLRETATPAREVSRRPVLLLRRGQRLLQVSKGPLPEVFLGSHVLKLARNQPCASQVGSGHRREAQVEDVVVELREAVERWGALAIVGDVGGYVGGHASRGRRHRQGGERLSLREQAQAAAELEEPAGASAR